MLIYCPALQTDGRMDGRRGGWMQGGCRMQVEEGEVEVVVLLVTNSDLRGALRTALTPYRLLRLALAHDWQQGLQEDVQQGLHHHLHLLLHRRVLQGERRDGVRGGGRRRGRTEKQRWSWSSEDVFDDLYWSPTVKVVSCRSHRLFNKYKKYRNLRINYLTTNNYTKVRSPRQMLLTK